ncbi:unnamed protein product [Paramecium octaurelia]|uniref:Uncharacterized protein n=1 Tax=Paramecium octaurelia TaxID=43137 RepID=A0A8S1WQI8_PAROT|nr:unnamed protein product [Paramecium octaurelia]
MRFWLILHAQLTALKRIPFLLPDAQIAVFCLIRKYAILPLIKAKQGFAHLVHESRKLNTNRNKDKYNNILQTCFVQYNPTIYEEQIVNILLVYIIQRKKQKKTLCRPLVQATTSSNVDQVLCSIGDKEYFNCIMTLTQPGIENYQNSLQTLTMELQELLKSLKKLINQPILVNMKEKKFLIKQD